MLELKNVTKTFGSSTVLNDVSFAVEPKEFVCVTGPSGAGKSTLISLIIAAEPVTSGVIEVDGVDLRAVPPGAMQLFRRRVGVVFQDYKLLNNRTVAENIAFPLEVCGLPDETIEKMVPELLQRVGMEKHAHSFPPELSGGEKTRVTIARAIVHKPIILLADEPTGNVDPEQAKSIIDLFKQIHEEGTTVILATHDADLVDMLKTRVIRLEDGRVVRDSVGGYYGKNGNGHGKKENGEGGEKVRITAIGS